MEAQLAVPKWFLVVAAAIFFVATSTVLLSETGQAKPHQVMRRYQFAAEAKPPKYEALRPNRFAFSMPIDDAHWDKDAGDIRISLDVKSVKPITDHKFQIADLEVPTWAEKLHPFHKDVLALHRYRNESDPPKHGRKFLIIFPFRDYKIGAHVRDASSGEDVIVTYAERTGHLGKIIPYLDRHLRAAGKIPVRDYNFLVMEQADMEVAFTKANVLNAAARLAREWGYDYMVMHDVDFFPAHPDNAYDLAADGLPVHYVSSGPFAPKFMTFGHHFGGVYAISVKTYFDVNGYPSEFWGWGPEDNLMLHQCARAGGVHRLNMTLGAFTSLDHNSDHQRNTGHLFMNNLRRFVAFYLNRREARKVPLEGVNELNATITRYAPMPHLGAVHWATVKLDTLRYRPNGDGVESKELQDKRRTGQLPPLSDIGLGPEGFVTTDPPLGPREIAFVTNIRKLEVEFFAPHETTDFIPMSRTYGDRTCLYPQVL